ncbi:MAG: hypothetical protein HN353_00340 [Bdellovibrionales bacterium]|jgi:hypothetical protein|nr:hypothetical protein [Bdellovibrionales bacterium]MBT3526418.1 hypothetical protein [Bdellovibrionales bacterium]MBT7670017.1 hypothetical protein [Bdellovibrionales bacterium]
MNDESDRDKEGSKESIKIADMIKRVVSVGVGAAFMTEDSVKALLAELPLPKDIINGLVQNAKGAKEEFMDSIQAEIRRHLSSIDPKQYLDEIVNNYEFEIDATVRLNKRATSGPTKKKSQEKKKR